MPNKLRPYVIPIYSDEHIKIDSNNPRVYLKEIIQAYFPKKDNKKVDDIFKKSFLLFPGNDKYHVPDQASSTAEKLTMQKNGGGLAVIASKLERTLSLPTTFYLTENQENAADPIHTMIAEKNQLMIAKNAIKDLEEAIAAGYHVLLPIRPSKIKKGENGKPDQPYFPNAWFKEGSNQYEFSAWGGIESETNIELANFYTKSALQVFEKQCDILPAKPININKKQTLTGNQNTLFLDLPSKKSFDKPINESPQQTVNEQLVNEIKIKETNVPLLNNEDFIIQKGNLNNTVKIAFDKVSKSAQVFFDYLNKQPNEVFSDLSFHKDNELYPMNKNGAVVAPGASDAKYVYIIRFEINAEFKKYLDHLNVEHADNLFSQLMDKNTYTPKI